MVNTLLMAVTSMTHFLQPGMSEEGGPPVFPSAVTVSTLCANLFFFISFFFPFSYTSEQSTFFISQKSEEKSGPCAKKLSIFKQDCPTKSAILLLPLGKRLK